MTDHTTIIGVNVVCLLVLLHLARRATAAYVVHAFPELQRLRTQDARDAAFRRANGVWRFSGYGVVGYVMAVLLALFLHTILNLSFGFYMWWLTFIPCFALAIFGTSLGNVYLRRERIARRIREELVGRSMPICSGCGYALDGLSDARCPECGQAFDREQLVDTQADPETVVADPAEPVTLEIAYDDTLLRRGMVVYWFRHQARKTIVSGAVLSLLLAWLIVTFGDRWFVGALGTLVAITIFSTYKTRQLMIQASLEKWGKKSDRSVRFCFSHEAVDVHSADGQSNFRWEDLEKLWRSKHVWLLFQSRYEPMLLPVEHLDDDLKSLITRKLLRAGVEVT